MAASLQQFRSETQDTIDASATTNASEGYHNQKGRRLRKLLIPPTPQSWASRSDSSNGEAILLAPGVKESVPLAAFAVG